MAETSLISVKGIKDFKSVQDLKEYTKAQYSTIIALTEQLAEANNKIKNLESILQTGSGILTIDENTFKDSKSGEILCALEIEKLLSKAKMTELSLEDTKKLDLLMKNLYLVKNHKKEDPKDADKDVPESELLALVAKS